VDEIPKPGATAASASEPSSLLLWWLSLLKEQF